MSHFKGKVAFREVFASWLKVLNDKHEQSLFVSFYFEVLQFPTQTQNRDHLVISDIIYWTKECCLEN